MSRKLGRIVLKIELPEYMKALLNLYRRGGQGVYRRDDPNAYRFKYLKRFRLVITMDYERSSGEDGTMTMYTEAIMTKKGRKLAMDIESEVKRPES
jgi:hypothetical protein